MHGEKDRPGGDRIFVRIKVLILVLVEYALRAKENVKSDSFDNSVLILVLVEYALRVRRRY